MADWLPNRLGFNGPPPEGEPNPPSDKFLSKNFCGGTQDSMDLFLIQN